MTQHATASQSPQLAALIASHESMLRAAAALGPALRSVDVVATPQMARAVQAQESFYDRIEQQYGLLTATQAGLRMGSISSRPGNMATQARKSGRLVALLRGPRVLFPGWQFSVDGEPLPVVQRLVALAAERGRSERGVVEWVSAASSSFDGRPPAAFLVDDPEAVVEVAADLWGADW